MRATKYAIDKISTIAFNASCMAASVLYLNVIGVDKVAILFILAAWTIILCLWFGGGYLKSKRRHIYLQSAMDNLQKKYLITQVINRPDGLTEQFYFDLLRQSEKAMLEEITTLKHNHAEYREYVEQWIHEIKSPLTALRLKCENDKSGVLQTVLYELGQIENYVEQALFFARADNMEKDFIVKQVVIRDVVNSAIVKNKHILMNTIQLDIGDMPEAVYSDSKSLEFVIGQIAINAAKYRKAADAVLRIYTEPKDNMLLLNIADNGIGILQSELPRVFDKGFTGTNGRQNKNSTGLGLFLCKQLCEQMAHEISIASVLDKGVTVTIAFRNT